MSGTGIEIGTRVGDRFIVEGELGAGGMGTIYRGKDERLGEAVAIKFLKRALLESSILRERFRREALSLAKLRHPGIVTVLDFGETKDGDLYTVLELVNGTTLADLLQARQSLTALSAAPIFDQILAALETCHEHDIIHRDIKPSNVMVMNVNGVEHVKLIDFGLARLSLRPDDPNKLTETGTVHGTPHYMAPEQCRGEEVGPFTDVYSAGIVFYEVLAGVTPFRGPDPATFMAQHLFVDPPPLDQVAPSISAGIAVAVHSALAKDPEDRPSARAFREALTSAFKGTDPTTLAEAKAEERTRVGGLSRSERALTRPAISISGSTSASASAPASVSAPIFVWMDNDDRATKLRGALATAGIASEHWLKAEPFPVDAGQFIAVIAFENLARLELLPPKSLVIVVDIKSPSETTEAIRAGASDMLLSSASEADLAAKIRRLTKRVRR